MEILEVVLRELVFMAMVWTHYMRQRFLGSLEELSAELNWAAVVSMEAFMCPSGSG